MQLEALTDTELTSSLDTLALRERENVVELLRHLIEFDSRKLYRELGYPSLFEYCTRRLKLSEGGACRRVSAARCLKDNPELEALLISGQVTLCTVATAAKSIEKKATTLTEISGCSKKEVQSIVAACNPVATKPREIIKPVIVEQPSKREERVKLEFSVTKETYEELKRIQSEFSIESGKPLSLEEVFEKLMKSRAQKRPSRRIRVRSSSSRYIPKVVKQEVFKRDQGQCSFVSKEGIRCCERKILHFDHIHPFGKGGLTQTSNLRLLCPAHNRLMAEQEFGSTFIQAQIYTATGGGR